MLRLLSITILTTGQLIAQNDESSLLDYFSAKSKAKDRGELESGFAWRAKPKTKPGPLKDAFGSIRSRKDRTEPDSPFATRKSSIRQSSEPKDAFARPSSTAQKKVLSDPFATKRLSAQKRAEIADHFTGRLREKQSAALPDAFSKRSARSDQQKERDAFAVAKPSKKHEESDLQSKGVSRKVFRKNTHGEPFRLIDRDPNRRKGGKKTRTNRDPFSFDKRSKAQPQSPRGESDLFPNGVLPKMTDLR